MSLIVDRIQLGPVEPEQVWEVFSPYILALIGVNVVGQACSKLQDYAIFKLEINGNYNLARLCFDTLSNQSMTFHTNRFGGSLVTQTTKFMTAYSLLVETILTFTASHSHCYRMHDRNSCSYRSRICRHPLNYAHYLHRCCLHHVSQNSPSLRKRRVSAKPTLRHLVRCGHQYSCGKNLRTRGLRANTLY